MDKEEMVIYLKKGDRVTYHAYLKWERGIIKRISDDGKIVFVVYHCNDDWDNYENYTAAATPIKNLHVGWV